MIIILHHEEYEIPKELLGKFEDEIFYKRALKIISTKLKLDNDIREAAQKNLNEGDDLYILRWHGVPNFKTVGEIYVGGFFFGVIDVQFYNLDLLWIEVSFPGKNYFSTLMNVS
ncbi:MAG: hypothetical protein ABIE43_04650 [Patescibacteria group bacterium]